MMMILSKKALLIMFLFVVLFVPLGQLSTVHSDPLPQTLESKAFACLTDVYPLNLTHYNVTADPVYTLSSASDTSTTQAVNYKLNSPDSNLVANFLFKDGKLYSLTLSVVNGSVVTSQSYDNLTDASRDLLLKYQAFSGADSTDLIWLLNHFDESKNIPVTLGNVSVSLRVSHLGLPNTGIVTTTFNWIYLLNVVDDTAVTLTLANNTFGGLFDSRQLYKIGSGEAITAATNYIASHTFTCSNGAQVNGIDVDKDRSVAKFFALAQNGTLQACWNVTLSLNHTYQGGVDALQMDVWANSGEVIGFRNQSVNSLQVNDSNMNPSVVG